LITSIKNISKKSIRIKLKLNTGKLSEIIMTVHFYEGQSYSWEYSNRSYDDSGCWEDYLTPDEYEEALDRKRFEQSNRGW
jgi:hypothetical protein